MNPRLLVTVALLVVVGACKKGSSNGPAPEAGARVSLPPDAQTPGALLADPKLQTGGMNGVHVKVHGYARILSPEKVSIGEAPDKSVPFLFCKGKVPPGLASGAHVLAEGTFDEMGNLVDCTVSPL